MKKKTFVILDGINNLKEIKNDSYKYKYCLSPQKLWKTKNQRNLFQRSLSSNCL